MLRCDHVQAGGKKFDFSKLGGPHSVVTSQHKPPIYLNTTYTVDLCRPLKKAKDAPKRETCPNGTRGKSTFLDLWDAESSVMENSR